MKYPMDRSNLTVQEESSKEKVDFSLLPNEVLIKIFSCLPLHDVMKLSFVCKHWWTVSSSDVLWGKFVPKYPGLDLPKGQSKKDIFEKLWKLSINIGREKWFPNPLPVLVQYDSLLRNEENKESGKTLESKCVLYLRLNPIYPFTTDGLNDKDIVMVSAVQAIFNTFGHKDILDDDPDFIYQFGDLYIHDAKSSMKSSGIASKQFALEVIVHCLESKAYLALKVKPNLEAREIDDEGDFQQKHAFNNCQQFANKPCDDSVLCNGYLQAGRRLSPNLFKQIRDILFYENDHVIFYELNLGCLTDVFPYARHLLVSDVAAIYCVDYYDLER